MRAICVNSFGGPEVFTLTEVDIPTPAATQVLVQVTVAGVNYLDVYQRTGVTPVATPYLAGVEGVGLIVEVGSEVTDLVEGQRVGWLTGGQGSFADYTWSKPPRPYLYLMRSMTSWLLRCSCRA
jgi:NADPH:quinone reductase